MSIQGELVAAPVGDILYAGPAPGYPGIQQMNLRVPQQLPPGGALRLQICGSVAGSEGCSALTLVHLQRP